MTALIEAPALVADAPPSSARPRTRGHLHEVDLFRIITFAAVVAVHTSGATNPPESTGQGAAAVLLHFTREAFFFLSGFVLVYSQGSRPVQVKSFWRKRFTLIGIPYLTWTAIYIGYNQIVYGGKVSGLPHLFVYDALTGKGYYHLYFLLVSMQVYLFFPVLLAVLRWCRNHPVWLVGSVAVFEVAEAWWLHRAQVPAHGAEHFYETWSYVLFPAYLLYIVAGAVVAQHLDNARSFFLRHRVSFLAFGVLSAVAMEGWYKHQVHEGVSPGDGWTGASAVLQPVMVLWSCGAVVLLALVSCAWAARRVPGSHISRALTWASSASFGVYLVHPLVLNGVLDLGLEGPKPSLVPSPWATLLAWVLTLIGAVVLVAIFRRTPFSLALTGRSRPARTVEAVTASAGAGRAGTASPV